MTPSTLDLGDFVGPGDTVLWGQGTGEPRTLTEALVEQRRLLGGINVFLNVLGEGSAEPGEFDHVVFTSRPPVFRDAPQRGPAEERIGALVAPLIAGGAVLQFGVGSVPRCVAVSLTGKADLGVHSGVDGDWIVDLADAGVVTNARKPIDTGITVTGAAFGSRRLYDFVHQNPPVQLRPVSYTHDAAVLSRIDGLVAINSAVEVDLTGQVHAETVGGVHIGAVGGQVDFVRAAMASRGGRSIIVLRSTARQGQVTRIVSELGDGVTTTPRNDADLVVTEHGVADIRGIPLDERARRRIDIAAPAFRDELEAGLPWRSPR